MASKRSSKARKKSKRKRKKQTKCRRCRLVKGRRHRCPEYECTHCNAVYHRNNKLKRHINRSHSTNQHDCDQCNKHFTSAEYLAQHKLTHVIKTCRICNQSMTAQSFKRHKCRPKWIQLPTNVIVEMNDRIQQHIDQSECGMITQSDATQIIDEIQTNHGLNIFSISRTAAGKIKDSGRRAVIRFLKDQSHSYQRRDSLRKRLQTPPPLTPLQLLVRYAENQPELVHQSLSQKQRDDLLTTLTLKTTSKEYENKGRRSRKKGRSNRGIDFSSDVMYYEKYQELTQDRSSENECAEESVSESIASRTRSSNQGK